jgi:hypothetical protein
LSRSQSDPIKRRPLYITSLLKKPSISQKTRLTTISFQNSDKPTFVIDCSLFRDVTSGLVLFNFRFQFRRKQLSVTSGEEAVRGEVELALDVVEADVEESVVLLV